MTELRLQGSNFQGCSAAGHSNVGAASHSRRKVRSLRATAKGRFRTRGRYSVATSAVPPGRGANWQTTDRCDGTLVTVSRGKVAVRDLRRNKTITVPAGKSYLAHAQK